MSRRCVSCIHALLCVFLAGTELASRPLTAQSSGDQGTASQGRVSESQQSAPGLMNRSETASESRVPRTYVLGMGDVIRVDVFEEPQFDGTIVVRPDGKISLPLVSDVYVAGLTPVATEQLLATKLTKYVKNPRVTVTVQEIHSRVVYVTGEVLRPGAYALADTINVVQLIARAGGVTPYAKKKDVYVLHVGSGLRTKVDYRKVLLGQHVEQNVQLNPGDTVVVP